MATVETLLSAEEYQRLPDNGRPSELVRGRIIHLNVPYPRHGEVCGQTVFLLKTFLHDNDIGRVVCNDSGVITERDPDTVRGPDVSFYSYQRVPKGPLPTGYLPVAPEATFEVRSPDDTWTKIHKKVGELLHAGVLAVCVLDPESRIIRIYFSDQPDQTLSADDQFAIPHILGEFRVPVRRFFE